MDHANIYVAVVQEFNQSGYKFTMDSLAKRLHVSKKTLYGQFQDKEMLFLATVDHVFDDIQALKQSILQDESLDDVEKIRRVLIALPDQYTAIDYSKIDGLQTTHPALYERVQQRVESDWEPILALMESAIEKGLLRPIQLPVFKRMLECSIVGFLNRKFQEPDNISYQQALISMLDILMEGTLQHDTHSTL